MYCSALVDLSFICYSDNASNIDNPNNILTFSHHVTLTYKMGGTWHPSRSHFSYLRYVNALNPGIIFCMPTSSRHVTRACLFQIERMNRGLNWDKKRPPPRFKPLTSRTITECEDRYATAPAFKLQKICD